MGWTAVKKNQKIRGEKKEKRAVKSTIPAVSMDKVQANCSWRQRRLVKVYNYRKAHLQIAYFVWPAAPTIQLAVTQMIEARGVQKKKKKLEKKNVLIITQVRTVLNFHPHPSASLRRSLWCEPWCGAPQGRGWVRPREAGWLHKEQRQLWQVSGTTLWLQRKTFLHLPKRALVRLFLHRAAATGT